MIHPSVLKILFLLTCTVKWHFQTFFSQTEWAQNQFNSLLTVAQTKTTGLSLSSPTAPPPPSSELLCEIHEGKGIIFLGYTKITKMKVFRRQTKPQQLTEKKNQFIQLSTDFKNNVLHTSFRSMAKQGCVSAAIQSSASGKLLRCIEEIKEELHKFRA